MSRTCPACFMADEVTQTRGFEGVWTFTCSNTGAHEPREPVIWEADNSPVGASDDVKYALAPLMGPLRACLLEGDPFVEYGIVEWRFRQANPVLFAELVEEHGHRELNKKETLKTTSAYLAQALGWLTADDSVVRVYGKATGAWSYNGQVTYWASQPAPPTTSRLSWVDFCRQEGLDPDTLA